MFKEILLAGFGGQGVLFAGKLLSYCGLLSDYEVSWLPSYGPEMRGGTANCSVCISSEPIGSPLVLEPDILTAMNLPSYDKFINTVKPGGMVFIDETLIPEKTSRTDITAFYIPASALASDNSLNGMTNMILIGKIVKETKLFNIETVEKAMHKSVPTSKKHLIEANMKAVNIGYEF